MKNLKFCLIVFIIFLSVVSCSRSDDGKTDLDIYYKVMIQRDGSGYFIGDNKSKVFKEFRIKNNFSTSYKFPESDKVLFYRTDKEGGKLYSFMVDLNQIYNSEDLEFDFEENLVITDLPSSSFYLEILDATNFFFIVNNEYDVKFLKYSNNKLIETKNLSKSFALYDLKDYSSYIFLNETSELVFIEEKLSYNQILKKININTWEDNSKEVTYPGKIFKFLVVPNGYYILSSIERGHIPYVYLLNSEGDILNTYDKDFNYFLRIISRPIFYDPVDNRLEFIALGDGIKAQGFFDMNNFEIFQNSISGNMRLDTGVVYYFHP
ncbi:hypothetical protein [Leeuwenhoekiella sp. NPDC079379]|uniref:hypothetical protein n=1 Tax=Leeuwenhoekiella sp. NPDC079379 TaxID=3364122 RepID=UPI0037C762A0